MVMVFGFKAPVEKRCLIVIYLKFHLVLDQPKKFQS